MKRCLECRELKDRALFSRHSAKPDGLQVYCKPCAHRRRKELNQALKKRLVEHFGGKCILCGYNRCLWALDFHHRDPATKLFDLSDYSRSFNTLLQEANKCVLICKNCHAEIHAKHSSLA